MGEINTGADEWKGMVSGRTDAADLKLTMLLRPSTAGGSGAFLALADDGNRYWVKSLNCNQGVRVPVTEQLVGRVGALVQAATCTVRTVEITADLQGWEFRPGRLTEPGIAHGSLAVDDVTEVHQMMNRLEDDNVRRQCSLLALYDLCWGSDPQWLRAGSQENRYFSHDHGWYFPPSGPMWTTDALIANVELPNEYPGDFDIPPAIVVEVCRNFESLSRPSLASALARIPSSWSVDDQELEAIGLFLERRARGVVARLRSRFMGGS